MPIIMLIESNNRERTNQPSSSSQVDYQLGIVIFVDNRWDWRKLTTPHSSRIFCPHIYFVQGRKNVIYMWMKISNLLVCGIYSSKRVNLLTFFLQLIQDFY